MTIHDLSFLILPQYHPLGRRVVFSQYLPDSLALADRVIAVSENTKRDLMALMGVPEEKIAVIPLAPGRTFKPVDERDTKAVLSRYGIKQGDYFLYVGTIEPRKNLIRLLKAFETYCAATCKSTRLVLVGRSGWLNRDFYRAVENSPWRCNIVMPGYVDEGYLPALYSGCIGMVYPSLYEGFGLPPLEAMACGSAVIVSKTSSLPEVVGEAGLMVDPLEVEQIAEAMTRLKRDARLREEMRRKGLLRAAHFTWRKTARMTLNTYGLSSPCPQTVGKK